ncbi:hypothetical protein MNV49_001092 [Pseudohyphozyma bogoriensis]|nr:hypothetical protein MNV49_001092 [Pseudohyphozyma bogoriensis]
MSNGTACYIDFAAGDKELYTSQLEKFRALQSWLASNGANYGFASSLDEVDEAGRESLLEVYNSATKADLTTLDVPTPLLLPRVRLSVSTSSGLSKTSKNFLDLLTDSRKLVSKRSPNPPLRYRGSKVHRIEEGFVVQGGDVTRGDGSGGESIYGGTFPDEKEGLKTAFVKGTLAMANSGKNSNSSQYFICLTSDPAKLKKLTGKYVAFGQADMSDEGTCAALERLDGLGDGKGGPSMPVWIEECGTL